MSAWRSDPMLLSFTSPILEEAGSGKAATAPLSGRNDLLY